MKNYFLFTAFVSNFITAVIALGPSSCFASLLLEPHIGYESSAVIANAASTPAQDDGYRTSGLSLGARVGYKLPIMLWFAGDVDYSTGKNTWNDTTVNTSSFDFTRTDLYALVGIDLPILFRGWVGYGFSSSNTLKDAVSSNTYKTTGTAVKAGVAFKGFPFINITAEAIVRTMTNYEATGAEKISVSSNFAAYKDAGVRIGLSLPFNL